MNQIIRIIGELDDEKANKIIDDFLRLNNSECLPNKIYILLSCSTSIYNALAITAVIRNLTEKVEVITVNIGCISDYSIAMFLAGTKHYKISYSTFAFSKQYIENEFGINRFKKLLNIGEYSEIQFPIKVQSLKRIYNGVEIDTFYYLSELFKDNE